MKGRLEGIESNWDSPGLGHYEVEFRQLPTVGSAFIHSRGRTSIVESFRREENIVKFRTRNTTYILEVIG